MILVTGGAGFIGSHVCEALLRQGEKVVCLDNLNAYYSPTLKRSNLDEVEAARIKANLPQDAFVFVEGDIRDRELLAGLFAAYSISAVIHLAAMAGVRPSLEDPVLYNDVNINGTLNILECMRTHKVSSLVFASSSSVYGNQEKVPFSEADFVDHPISPYAATKKAGELLCHTYHHLYGISTACLRFFTVYGPRQRPDLAIRKFAGLILNEQPLPFYGDGSTRRDYTYIDDIVSGIMASLAFARNPLGFEVFNLGESHTVSLQEMVSTLEDALGKKAILNRQPMQPGDVLQTFADVSKAKALLDYRPSIPFPEGIARFVEWYLQKAPEARA